MAIFIWQGNGAGTKTDADDGRNWINEAGSAYAEARYPGSSAGIEDDVYLDAACTNGCTTGCDLSAAETLNSLRVGPLYNKDLGASGGYFKAEIREVVVQATAAPHVYLYGSGSGDGFTKTTVTDGADVKFNGEITDPVFLKGTIECAASMTISSSLTVGYISNVTTDVILTLNSGITLPATMNISGGTINNSNAVTTLDFVNGDWTQVTGDLTNVNQSGGNINWNGGNLTTLKLYGGTCDASGDTSPRRIGDAYVYQQGALNLDNGQDNILVTGEIHCLGGTVTYPNGYEIAPSPTLTYAGASDAKQGISPQTINNSTANGDGIYVGLQERLEIYCTCGAIAGGGAVAYTAKESDAVGGSYSAISGKSASFTDTDDNKTKKITVWGHDLTSGKPYVRVEVIESGVQNALVSAVCIKSTF